MCGDVGTCVGMWGDMGTRWKNEIILLRNLEKWDVFIGEYRGESIDRMIERAHSLEGKRYDNFGILGFATITGQVFNNKNAWYCSEACWLVLTGIWMKRISPRRMSKKVSGTFNKITQ